MATNTTTQAFSAPEQRADAGFVLRTEGLFKIFGRRAEEALQLLQSGAPFDEVKHLGVTPAVVDVSFEVEPGEVFVVMGLSGSGKSTLIRMLNGLLQPTGGHIYVDGRDLVSLGPKELRKLRRDQMSMVFQHFALLPHRTVLENAGYALKIREVSREEQDEKAQKALSMVGLEGQGHRLPHQLSGGMKQRVGLARALAAETPIMLMDEAFSALDPLIRREMQDQLLNLQSTLQKTIIFITHDLNEAMRLGDRIAMMRDGRIVQIGTAEEILQDPANDYVAQFVHDVDRTRVLTASAVMEPAGTVVTDTQEPQAVLRQMREEKINSAFVVSRDERLRGTIRADAAQAAISQKRTDMRDSVEQAIAVSPDTLLADVFRPSVDSPVPVAVIDPDGRLLGMIPQATLLSALARLSTENGPAAEDLPDPESGG